MTDHDEQTAPWSVYILFADVIACQLAVTCLSGGLSAVGLQVFSIFLDWVVAVSSPILLHFILHVTKLSCSNFADEALRHDKQLINFSVHGFELHSFEHSP